MTPLQNILEAFRQAAQTEREKGTYFEELICTYFRYEATYADLYSDVWMFGDWAKEHPEFGISANDTGIDLVAKTRGSNEYHAIQCKCYAEDYRLQKAAKRTPQGSLLAKSSKNAKRSKSSKNCKGVPAEAPEPSRLRSLRWYTF